MTKFLSIIRKAPFPAIVTIIYAILFLVVYWLMIVSIIEPYYYFIGLIFAIPFIIFGSITLLVVEGKLKKIASSILTGILIPVLGFVMLIAFIYIMFIATLNGTTSILKYGRVLNKLELEHSQKINLFPSRIPQDATDIKFHYHPWFLQGGEEFVLKFKTNSESIHNYINEYSSKAIWTGSHDQGGGLDNGVDFISFDYAGYGCEYNELPEDFVIYLFYSRPGGDLNWNHGEVWLTAISTQRNEIIFLEEGW